MKQALLLLTICAICSMSATAAVIRLNAGGNVGTTLAAVTTISGDTIELTQVGTYLWNAQVAIGNGTTNIAAKSITIRAAAGLATRPIVQCQAVSNTVLSLALYKSNGSQIVLDGIDFDGNGKVSYLWTVKSYNTTLTSPAPAFNIRMNNCEVRNFSPTTSSASLAYAFSYSNSAGVTAPGYLSVSNSKFEGLTTAVLYSNGAGRPDSINFTNCYFKGSYAKGAIHTTDGLVASQIRKAVIDHCTFDGGTSPDLSLANITVNSASSTAISNCIFANNSGTIAISLGRGGNLKNHCAVYFAGAANTVYADSLMDATTVKLDPVFDTMGFATALSYVGAASDGKMIGFWAAEGLINGIKTIKMDRSLTVYQRGSMLLVNGAPENASYSIYNVNGSIMQSGTIAAGSLMLTSDAKGIYFFRANNQAVRFIVR